MEIGIEQSTLSKSLSCKGKFPLFHSHSQDALRRKVFDVVKLNKREADMEFNSISTHPLDLPHYDADMELQEGPSLVLDKPEVDMEFNTLTSYPVDLPLYDADMELKEGPFFVPEVKLIKGDFVKCCVKSYPPIPVFYSGKFWAVRRFRKVGLTYIFQLFDGEGEYLNLDFECPEFDGSLLAVFELEAYCKAMGRYFDDVQECLVQNMPPIVKLNKLESDAKFDSITVTNFPSDITTYMPSKELKEAEVAMADVEFVIGDFVKGCIQTTPPIPVFCSKKFWTVCRSKKVVFADPRDEVNMSSYICQLGDGEGNYIIMEFGCPQLDDCASPALFEREAYMKCALGRDWDLY